MALPLPLTSNPESKVPLRDSLKPRLVSLTLALTPLTELRLVLLTTSQSLAVESSILMLHSLPTLRCSVGVTDQEPIVVKLLQLALIQEFKTNSPELLYLELLELLTQTSIKVNSLIATGSLPLLLLVVLSLKE